MNILIVTHYFPPEPHRLIEELAGTLKDFGHTVRVLTGFPNWPSGRLHPDYPVRFLRRERLAGVEVFRTPVYPDHSRSAIKRIVNLLSLAVSAALIAPFAVPRCDVVWVISPPTLALPGWLLSRLWKAPLIYDIQDMWPETLASTQMMKSSWSAAVAGWFMNRIYRACASIRVISPGFRNDLIGKGVAPEKVHYVPNWVDTEFYAPSASENTDGREKRFRVVYAGNIGSSQGLGVVLDAAEILRHERAVEFVLAGDGVDLSALKRSAADRSLKNVKFPGRLAPDEMPRLYTTADALLVQLRDEPIHRITIPHKTLAYLAAGKPVIAAARGDVAEVVRAAEAGISCEPDCGMALANAVRQLAAMPELDRLKLGRNGRAAACRDYSRIAVVRKLEWLCRNAAAPAADQNMSLKYRPADSQDVARIVRVHEQSFPGFFLTQLGPGFLRALYAGMIGSNDGIVIVAETGAEYKGLAGFVAGSSNQAKLYRELRNRRLPAFGFSAAVAAVRNPGWSFRLLRAIGRPREAAAMSSTACLMSIAVDPSYQASGVGSELVRQFEAKLVQLGCCDYCLTTDLEHNAPVRKFYERLGLSVVRETTTREGRPMLEYYKRIVEVR